MKWLQEYRRRTIIPLAGLALAAYYLFVYLPLNRQSTQLDQPLERSWKQLVNSLGRSNAPTVDFLRVTNQLKETRQALSVVDEARRTCAGRLQLGNLARSRMDAPFQLVEFQNERSQDIDILLKLAQQQKVTVDPVVWLGFPEHTADVRQPALLWAALSMVNGLMTTALECKLSAIYALETPLVLTNTPATHGRWSLEEIPIQIEFSGPAANVAAFLEVVPLRAEEVRIPGVKDAPVDKTPLFIQRILMKKQTPEKTDDVRVSLRAVGFVFRE
jgi:hypothetical protein